MAALFSSPKIPSFSAPTPTPAPEAPVAPPAPPPDDRPDYLKDFGAATAHVSSIFASMGVDTVRAGTAYTSLSNSLFSGDIGLGDVTARATSLKSEFDAADATTAADTKTKADALAAEQKKLADDEAQFKADQDKAVQQASADAVARRAKARGFTSTILGALSQQATPSNANGLQSTLGR